MRPIDEVLEQMREQNVNWTLAFLKTKAPVIPEYQLLECLKYLTEEIDKRAENEKRKYIEKSTGKN